jgi:hypothetical protein
MTELPLQMLCSTKFGRYPKISREQVFNMFQSDGWIVNYAGHAAIKTILENGIGRGIFYSARSNKLYVVVSQNIYTISFSYGSVIATFVGVIDTLVGDVFIDENIQSQIAFCDKQNIYLYDYSSNVFIKLNLDFVPGYITFQDEKFIAPSVNLPAWRLSNRILLNIVSATVNFGGASYTNGDTLTLVNGNNSGQVKVTGESAGVITSVGLTSNTGSGYITGVYSTIGGTGSGAKISVVADDNCFPYVSACIGSFQTKPDNVVACVRMPSKNGQLLVMGSTVTEIYTDLGLQIFPYQRSSGYNIDYGCVNPATIAVNDDFVVWLGSNERSGPVIMYCTGGQVQQISTDGINYRLENLHNPQNSYGFIFRQDGHIFYQLTFPDPLDNVTYTYDFNTKKFFTLCDAKQNCHIAKRVAYYNNDYYFISFSDGKLYKIDTKYTTYNGMEIPRIIITSPSCLPTRDPFIINSLTFPIEQGADVNKTISTNFDEYIVDNTTQYMLENNSDFVTDGKKLLPYNNYASARVDISTSSDGAVTFGNPFGIWLNTFGKRRNIFNIYNLGRYNEVTFQFRFWGFGRFVLTDGVADITKCN